MHHISLIVSLLLLPGLLLGCAKPDKDLSRDAESHYIYGVSNLQEGDATAALKEFLQAVELAPEDPKIHAALGQAYQLKGAYQLAEEQYLIALRGDGNNPQIRNNLGALYLDLQQWDKAIEQFRIASSNLLFAHPEVSLTGIGLAFYNEGNYLDAVESCKKALLANPQYAQAHYYLGESYYALDRNDLAVKSYQAALKIAPGYLAARYKLAMALMRQEQKERAREEFREILRQAPDSEQGRLAAEYLELLGKK